MDETYFEKTVLIVEDQLIIAFDLRTYLKRWGFVQSYVFRSGKKAIDFLENFTPSLGVVDLKLSDDISGFEVAKILKQRNVPFIFCSVFSNPKDLKLAKDMAPLAIVKKPFEKFEEAMDKFRNTLSIKNI
jgi:two-component system, NtrC family, response regulator HydG